MTDRPDDAAEGGREISYMAITVGTPVVSVTGTRIGEVHRVLQVPDLDLFSGLSVKTRHGLRFVERDRITEITTTLIKSSVADDEIATLPPPSGPAAVEVDLARDEGTSWGARLGRRFGRTFWRNIDR